MTLNQYLDDHDVSVSAFARGCSLAEGTIRRVLKGDPPTLKNAITISDRTFGKVALRDLCPGDAAETTEARA